MGCFIRRTIFFVLLSAGLSHCSPATKRRVFSPAIRRYSRNLFKASFLTDKRSFGRRRRTTAISRKQYAKKSVDELNKRSIEKFKYVFMDVIGGQVNDTNKTLEIVAKFGRTRCQKTEDRYFCQTSPELHLEEKLYKVKIQKKTSTQPVKFEFEEKPTLTLPAT